MLVIPFSLLPPKVVVTFSKTLKNIGEFLSAFFPGLRETLLQAEMPLQPREYTAIAFVVAVFNMLGALFFMLLLGFMFDVNLVAASVVSALVIAFASFVTIIYYPQIIVTKRMRALENQMIPATRQLLIELKSGVPLFNAMASVSVDYGEVSKEFRKIVKKMNSGVPELDALSEATVANPSPQFRKILWQISNALKVGSDVASVIEQLLAELTRERIDQIRKYGQELSPWTMIYMMAAVILPSLGVTMLIVIASFMSVGIPSIVLPVIVMGLIGFQLFFMNFVSSRRPVV
ncbi:MAG: type II secretion system F family protein [Candidatus Micrarchaeota archaeon]